MVSDNQCPWKPAIQVSKYCRPFPTLELGGVKDIGSPRLQILPLNTYSSQEDSLVIVILLLVKMCINIGTRLPTDRP